MVNGLYRGCKGVLQEINTDKFQALVSIMCMEAAKQKDIHVC
jgi:hypothetical protein